ncbi:MAG: OmpA family protein, partial [Saprospiraceae bacterium]|nr:OmpA family protein [Saprospiraceae bacterium]
MSKLLNIVIAILIYTLSFGQGDEIILSNPSFEEVPHQGVSTLDPGIRGWYDCGSLQFPAESPPDIHPVPSQLYDKNSYWQVTKEAQDGDTYLGLVVRDNDSWESVSQRLPSTLYAGSCYEVSLFLVQSERYISGSKELRDKYQSNQLVNYTEPAVLRIWAGTGVCGRQEKLAESRPVGNTKWEKYTFKLEPTRDYNYITLEAFYEVPVLFAYNGHILVDNISSIKEIPCNDLYVVETKPEIKKSTPKTNRTSQPKPKQNNVVLGQSSPTSIDYNNTNQPKKPKKVSGLGFKEISKGQIITIENLYFNMDKSEIKEESFKELNTVYNFLDSNDDVVVEIGGHTNTVPPKDFCMRLSKERAKAVADYLVDQGIPE